MDVEIHQNQANSPPADSHKMKVTKHNTYFALLVRL